MTPPWSLTAARACHRAILRLAPRDTQRRYGADMRHTFDVLSLAAHERGTAALVALLCRELVDVFAAHRHIVPASGDPMTRRWLDWSQLVPAWRSLLRRPAYATAVILTLTLGTGVTTTLFAVVETVLLRPLPYPNGEQLVTLNEASPTAPGRPALIAPGRLADWSNETTAFSVIAGTYTESVTDTSGSHPERLDARRVTPGYMNVFAAEPAAGRTFTAEEEVTGGPRAVVISDGFWTRRFARDPQAIGRALTIGNQSYVVVGVMSRTFAAPTIDAWLPAQISAEMLSLREARFLTGVGRLKPGVTLDQGRQDLLRIQTALGEQFPKTDRGWTVIVNDLRESRVGTRRSALLMVFGAVAVTWLVGLANIAGLVIVHTQRRARELSIRTALGASRLQVINLIVHEMALFAVIGGGAGLVLAMSLLRVVPQVFDTLPRLNELSLDWRSALFAIGTSVLAALCCALWPALRATRRQTLTAQAHGSRGTTASAHWSQRVLVGAQVALGVVLCTSAAFLASSYYALTTTDLGFESDDVVTFRVGARWDEDRSRVGQMQEQLVAQLSALPGVSGAGMTNFLPAPGGGLRYQVKVAGLAGESAGGYMPTGMRMISAGYHEALRVPLASGTGCGEFRFDFNMPRTAMVNRTFIERHAGGQSLIGRELKVEGDARAAYTIVGVVADVAEDGVQAERAPFVYSCDSAGSWPDPHYVVRTTDADGFSAQLREVMRTIDPTRAVFAVRPLTGHLDASIAEPRLNAGIVITFAASALLLGALGLYALFSRLVTESRREIGVRLALGATPSGVVRMVVADAGRLLVGGLIAGAALSVGTHQLIGSWLPKAAAFDGTALSVAALVLAVVSACAVMFPALRAAHIAPTEALRSDG
jgi:putative ABC transport system permease protein